MGESVVGRQLGVYGVHNSWMISSDLLSHGVLIFDSLLQPTPPKHANRRCGIGHSMALPLPLLAGTGTHWHWMGRLWHRHWLWHTELRSPLLLLAGTLLTGTDRNWLWHWHRAAVALALAAGWWILAGTAAGIGCWLTGLAHYNFHFHYWLVDTSWHWGSPPLPLASPPLLLVGTGNGPGRHTELPSPLLSGTAAATHWNWLSGYGTGPMASGIGSSHRPPPGGIGNSHRPLPSGIGSSHHPPPAEHWPA